jgi:hypothetical protein
MHFKWNLPIWSAFAFIIINVKAVLNFEKEWCTFDKEKIRLEKKKPVVTVALNMQNDYWNIVNLHQVLNNETYK